MVLSTLDYIIIAVVLVFGIWGAIKGFIEEIARKFGYFAGLVVAFMFTKGLERVFTDNLDLPLWVSAGISYIILFLAGFLLIKGLGNMLQNIFETANLTAVDNLAGLLLGLIEGVVVVGLVEVLLSHQTIVDVRNLIDSSQISSEVIIPVFDWISEIVQKVF